MDQKTFLFFYLLLLFSIVNPVNAQFGFSHEIGLITGAVALQSDYGEKNDFETNSGNTGYGIGLVHYLNFAIDERGYFKNNNFFNDHCKIRTELSYNKTNLEHLGKWVEGKPSLRKQQLLEMSGSTAMTNIGIQLEFSPLSIRYFTESTFGLAPFASIGGQYSFYNTKAWSTMGPLGTSLTTFPKYLTPTDDRPHGFSSESSAVWSIVSSIGMRYKLSPLSDLMVDLRWQYYFSDWVDGLKPNPALYKENKSNDMLLWFNVGYIHYL